MITITPLIHSTFEIVLNTFFFGYVFCSILVNILLLFSYHSLVFAR